MTNAIQDCIARLECIINRGRLPLDELGHLMDIKKILEDLLKNQ